MGEALGVFFRFSGVFFFFFGLKGFVGGSKVVFSAFFRWFSGFDGCFESKRYFLGMKPKPTLLAVYFECLN